MSFLINAVERGLIPNIFVRMGIRKLLQQRLSEIARDSEFHRTGILAELQKNPIALATDIANEQHYEVPSEFFFTSLGKHLKYSCSLFEQKDMSLDQAEAAMLELYCQRAELEDGMSILELGCGWGSLTLFLAEKYPHSQITAISNSHSQRAFIEKQAENRKLDNLQIITQDMNEFDIEQQFDRILSIEMFEHMRNYQFLFNRVANWLKPDGKVFIHIFCHKEMTYFYETEGDDNWMGKYFFTGGIMPSYDLFERVQKALTLEQKWMVDGSHYQRTCEEWFKKMDHKKKELMPILNQAYGQTEGRIWFHRWKLFYAACAELFGFNNGQEWFVGHYLFTKTSI